MTGKKADQELSKRIQSFFHQRRIVALGNVGVDVLGGVVTISGAVRSFYEKQIAISCCQRVAGVVRLIDQVEVVQG
ncbi:MAG: BON domain-containing protein [bacterium]|nr:BON domain-containing protein [bacterium]